MSGKPNANAWAAKPPPNRIPPIPSRRRRDMTRVSWAWLSWTRPADAAPKDARKAIVSTLTWNSSMILRKIRGSRNAWA